MNKPITTEQEDYYYLKYGFSLNIIHNIWRMSNDADELQRNFEAAKSLRKTFASM